MEKGWIKARLIIEIAGFPQEHISKTLALVADKFSAEKKEVKVLDKKIRQPKKISAKIYSGFVELEAAIKDLATLIGLIFDWMPSSIEILEPEGISEKADELQGILNDLAARLHQYDATVKTLKAKLALAAKRLKS